MYHYSLHSITEKFYILWDSAPHFVCVKLEHVNNTVKQIWIKYFCVAFTTNINLALYNK